MKKNKKEAVDSVLSEASSMAVQQDRPPESVKIPNKKVHSGSTVPKKLLDAAPVQVSEKSSVQATERAPEQVFQFFLTHVHKDVNCRLAGYLDACLEDCSRHGPDVDALVGAVRDLTLRGGKRLRACLVLLGYLAVDQELPWDPALDAGVAFELLQTYLLVHDDWMDGDDVRRGGPSVHTMLRKYYGSERLGNVSAILAGDYACAMALDVLARVDVDPGKLVHAMALFAEIQQDVICGQQLDVSDRPMAIEQFYPLKTGSYTIRGPLLLGAALAGAPASVMRELDLFAYPIGIAFQIRDDLLGVFGDAKRIGKPVGQDIRRGAQTAVTQQAALMLNAKQRARYDQVFGNLNATDEQMKNVTDMLRKAGVYDAVTLQINELVLTAIDILETASVTAAVRTALLGFCSMIATRDN